MYNNNKNNINNNNNNKKKKKNSSVTRGAFVGYVRIHSFVDDWIFTTPNIN